MNESCLKQLLNDDFLIPLFPLHLLVGICCQGDFPSSHLISQSFIHSCMFVYQQGFRGYFLINEYNPILSGLILVRLTELVSGKPFELCDLCCVPE